MEIVKVSAPGADNHYVVSPGNISQKRRLADLTAYNHIKY
jgi:hypothetical protein